MPNIDQLHSLIADAINQQSFIKQPEELYAPIEYTLKQTGKRMRPLMVLLGCELFNGDLETAMPAALGIEVFHNFTLIHDDIMDQSPIRRGKETVYKKWNTNIAILSGDAMFIEGYKLMMQLPTDKLRDVLTVYNQTAIEVCEGQQYDMNFETHAKVSIADYMEMIRLKTAVLVAGSLQIGAILANASAEDSQKLYRFGECIGIAFQLKDDILDAFGDIEKFGKQPGTDIVSNKKTFLYLKAIELATPEQRIELKQAYEITDPNKKIETVLALFNQLNVRLYAEKAMEGYFDNALGYLKKIEVPEEQKENLKAIANILMNRES